MRVSRETKAEEELARQIAKFFDDPMGFVMWAYPWASDPSIQVAKLMEPWKSRYGLEYGPDVWACETLDEIGEEVRARGFDGRTAVDPQRWSIASGHGIGKSVIVAWLIHWIMSTRPRCKGTVTAGTDTQLRTKTWAELGKWHARAINRHWFDYSNSRGNMQFKRIGVEGLTEGEWVTTAQTCREENSQAFAGQHAATSTSFYIFDEASAVPDKIYDVRDPGGLTDGEPMIFDFGNPTSNSGMFYENTVGRMAHRFKTKQIDSRTVQISNKKLLNEMIKDYGIDSDRVKVRILGQFPSSGDVQFIPKDYVDQASNRSPVTDFKIPLVLGVDVARKGSNDSVIYPRHGDDAKSWEPRIFSGLDTVQFSGKIVECYRDFEKLGLTPAMICIDGTGVGGGVVDIVKSLGYPVTEVQFASSPVDKNMYKFKVDELWGKMKEHLKNRLALPSLHTQIGRRLKNELIQREYGHTTQGQIRLESKEDMEERLGNDGTSPDVADALSTTYAVDVASLRPGALGGSRNARVKDEHNPVD